MLLAKSADRNGNQESLFDHSRRVAEMAGLLCDRLPPSIRDTGRLKDDLKTAALLHDIGKAASGFQDVLLGRRRDWNGWRHEILSAAFASNLHVAEEIIFAVITHHRQIPGQVIAESGGRLRWHNGRPEDWERLLEDWNCNEAEALELWRQLCELFDRSDLLPETNTAVENINLDPAWLDYKLFRRQQKYIPPERRLRASLLRGLLMGADHLSSAGIDALPPVAKFKEFSPHFELRGFQKKCAKGGNLILRAPTGSGKTEAALIWAGVNQPENGRFFYTLPYTAALNAMHARLEIALPGHRRSIGLLHGRAAHHLYEAAQQDLPADKGRATKEARARARLAHEMYYPVRVCTPHQLLRFALCGKGWEQMLSEIPGSCVVFDEVHTYDPALAGLTLGTARLFGRMGAKLMFISATLPRFLEEAIKQVISAEVMLPDPDSDSDREILDRKRHIVTVVDHSLLESIPDIVKEANSGKRVLVVCNHVRSAQKVAGLLRSELEDDDAKVSVFHGRFNMRDRKIKERALSSGPLPNVLVATQVVEVSLDMSFDVGFFEAAPIDALAQRMGRVNRKGTAEQPASIVIARRAINKHRLYDSDRTKKTLNLLSNKKEPVSEQDLVEICDRVYEGGYLPEEQLTFDERLNYPPLADFETHVTAGQHKDWIEKIIEERAGRGDVLPKELLKEYEGFRERKQWLDADALLLNNIYLSGISSFLEPREDFWIVDLPYDKDGLEAPGTRL